MPSPPGSDTAGEVTRLLKELGEGDPRALDRLYPLVYDELRRAAQRALRAERAEHTLQATDLVHEVFLKLAGSGPRAVHDRTHFLGVAARAMRQVLVDHARRRHAAKRGGDLVRTTLGDSPFVSGALSTEELIALDDALERLEAHDGRLRQVVEMRYFAGLSEREIATALGVTERTVQRDWVKARAWLHKELYPEVPPG
jgi:RNA polymerase sigma factor (TIGR02999 family)